MLHKGGRVELTLLTQAIKVLSYTHIQAIMEGVEEIQMSLKTLKQNTTSMLMVEVLFIKLCTDKTHWRPTMKLMIIGFNKLHI